MLLSMFCFDRENCELVQLMKSISVKGLSASFFKRLALLQKVLIIEKKHFFFWLNGA